MNERASEQAVARVGEREGEGELFKRNMKDINFFIIVYEMNFTNLRKYPRVCVFFCEYLSNAYIQYHHTHTHMEPASERASATEYLLTIVLSIYTSALFVNFIAAAAADVQKGKKKERRHLGENRQ